MKLIALRKAAVCAIAISCSFLPTVLGAQSCKCPKNPGPGGGVHCASNQIATCDPTSGECNCTCDSAQQGKTKAEYEAQIFSQVLHKKVDPAELSSPEYEIPSASFRKAPQYKGTFSFDIEEPPAGRSQRPGKIRVGVPEWLEKVLESNGGVSVGPGALLQNCPDGRCNNGNNDANTTSATTFGSNSPAVGSITQTGPCSVNQIGGTQNSASPNCTLSPTQVRYEVNGVRHTSMPGKMSVDDSKFPIFQKMTTLVNAGKWSDAAGLADKQMTDSPEWPTPFYYAAKSYVNLCDKDAAIRDFKLFLEKVKDRDDYTKEAQNAADLLSRMEKGEMPPQCP